MEKAVQLATEYEWAWTRMSDWSREEDTPLRAVELARKLTAARPDTAGYWRALASTLAAADTGKEERLGALEHLLELRPGDMAAWDARAEILTDDKKFDEARKCCDAGIAACPRDACRLRGRKAYIEFKAGNAGLGEAMFRDILREHSQYTWGWWTLAEICMDLKKDKEAREALETSLKLTPGDSWATRNLARLLVMDGKRSDAIALLTKTQADKPSDWYLARDLMDTLLDAGQSYRSAAETLVLSMQRNLPCLATDAYTVVVRMRQGRIRDALDGFRALARNPASRQLDVGTPAKALADNGHIGSVARIVRRALKDGTCSEQAVLETLKLLAEQERDLAGIRLWKAVRDPKLRLKAGEVLAVALSERKYFLTLRLFVLLHGRELARDDGTWAQLCYALVSNPKSGWIEKHWVSLWRHKGSIALHTYFNASLVLLDEGRFAEARALAEDCYAKLGTGDDARANFHLFDLIETALYGDISEASKRLDAAKPRNINMDLQLVALARLLVDFRNADRESRGSVFQIWTEKNAELFDRSRVRIARKLVRRTMRRVEIALLAGGGGFKVWTWFEYRLRIRWTWLILLALVRPYLFLAGGVLFLGDYLRSLQEWREGRRLYFSNETKA